MLATAELYDRTSGTWTATGAISGPRVESAFALLEDGKVFVVGGFALPGDPEALLATAEVYDPQSSAWSQAGAKRAGSFDLTATLLPNGDVLVAGGLLQSGVTASADLFDPAP